VDVTLWGTRGTFPVPGPATVRYGGDTTCLSVEMSDRVLVIDSGTGIRLCGEALSCDTRDIAVLFTHIHADHVMGFPFFAPLYEADRSVSVIDHRLGAVEWSATTLLDGTHFPLTAEHLPCNLHRISMDPVDFLENFGIAVRRTLLNHPGGAYGYRFEDAGKSFVFIPDNEVRPPKDPTVTFEELVSFCRGADVLIHDAQFTEQECEERCGWGHSTPDQACDLAAAAGVERLLLTHHDPARTDDELDDILIAARARLGSKGVAVEVAADGLKFTL
jgi:phosphoribosyl 1,2-cyclic phosphodiesterase